MNKQNQKLILENENLENELAKQKFQQEKMKLDFENELKELKYQVYSEESKKHADQISHLEIRLKSYEDKKNSQDQTYRNETDESKLRSKQEIDKSRFRFY